MSRTELEGYHGPILQRLEKANAKIGGIIRVTSKDGEVFEGALFPRSDYIDRDHICLKMRNGYNIGIHLDRAEKLEVIAAGQKPHFTKPKPAPKHEGLPRVSLISVGGTIASRVDYRSGAVQPALTAEDLTSVVPELASIADVEADILYTELSENLTTTHWEKIAEEVAGRIRQGSEGIVIAHGTDTMHYTAAALSFALQSLPCPVLLVGSQRSSDRPSSDAASNLTGGVGLAARANIASVGIAMHEDMSDRFIVAHTGTRVRKCHTSRRDTFRSINSPPLARYDLSTGEVELLGSQAKRDKTRSIIVKPHFDRHASLLKFHPNFDPATIESVVSNGARGIILEGTGLGHISQQCYGSIKKVVEQETAVFMTSQTIWGRVDMNVYSTGRDLLNIGVVPLEDMLPETAVVKLMWTLAQTKKLDSVREMMVQTVAGEITARTLPEAS